MSVVPKVTGSFFRRERCEVCGKTAERHRSFTAPTYAEMANAGYAWTEPLRHKKCEGLPVPTRGATS